MFFCLKKIALLNSSSSVNKAIPVLFWNSGRQRLIRKIRIQQFCIILRTFVIAINLSPSIITIRERSHLAHFVCNSETWVSGGGTEYLVFVKTDWTVNPHET